MRRELESLLLHAGDGLDILQPGGVVDALGATVEDPLTAAEGAGSTPSVPTDTTSSLRPDDALGHYRDLGVSDLSIVPGQDDETSLATVREWKQAQKAAKKDKQDRPL